LIIEQAIILAGGLGSRFGSLTKKIQLYSACRKPIVSMMDGEGSRIIEEAKSGLTYPAENPQDLTKNVIRMKEMQSGGIAEMGRNARKYYDRNFERSYLFGKAEDIFKSMQRSYFR